MFKFFTTLVRGAAAAAEEELTDRHALLILDQHIRDAAAGIERSKRALAIAIAQDDAEAKRLEKTLSQIADLEKRAIAALDGGREDLANEAAEAIALLEADRDALREARATFASEIARLKRIVTDAGRRLTELERGRRIAQAAESVRRLKADVSARGVGNAGALLDAEATLKRLRERQAEEAAASTAYDELNTETAPKSVAERLEAQGFGPRTRPTAASVLERLKQQAAKPSAQS